MQAVFNDPVVAVQRQQALGTGSFGTETGDTISHFARQQFSPQIGARALDAEGLRQVREIAVADQVRTGPDTTRFDAPVALSVSVCGGGKRFQVEVGDVLLEGRLIVFDREEVIGLFGLDHVARRVVLSMQSVRSYHGAGEREPFEQGGAVREFR
jgi:hypothetical protein